MRILYLLNTLKIGGAERLVIALGERMAARGHDVRVLTLCDASPDDWPTTLQVSHLGIGRNPASLLAGIPRVVSHLRSFRPHLVHSHNFHGNVLARGLKLACPSVRVVSTLHNEYEGGRARMLGLKLTDPLSQRTVAVSHAVAERAWQLGIVPGRKCQVITNGIDITEFAPDPARRARVRDTMGAGEDFIWLTAGRIAEAKDYPNLLRAFASVHEAAPNTQLWVAGDGEDDYVAALRISAHDFGIEPVVHWLGTRTDMPRLVDAADGFVLASAWEGMPLAVAEAMAMEKVVVATGVGGVAELADHCGLLVPPRNPEALGRAMMSVLNTPREARAFLGRQARQRIVQDFNIDAKADAWEALYRDTAQPTD